MNPGYVEYSSNNSGGSWWLTDENWKALEAAGWIVAWKTLGFAYNPDGSCERGANGVPVLKPHAELPTPRYGWPTNEPSGRWLGALATEAFRVGLGIRDAVAEFERITGADSADAGCACCGQPHSFTEYDATGEVVADGPRAVSRCEW